MAAPDAPFVRTKNPYQSFLMTVVVLWALASSCGSFAFENSGVGASIEPRCSVAGTGDGQCTFTNTGWSPGSACVRVGLQRNSDQQLFPPTLACSGRLDVNDSRTVQVAVLDGAMGPIQFCGGGLATPWTSLCSVTVEQAHR